MSKPTEARCPRCAAPLPPSAPEGLCPRCLGALNLATDTVLTGADAIAAQPPLTPAELAPHFPQLEIIECLGRGGMGVVYRVRQKALNRLAALKLLAPERVTDAGFAERFTREAQALARLNHPNIVTIYDFGFARAGALEPPSGAQLETPNSKPETAPAGFYFLLMEFMDGVNLRQAMKAGRFTPEQALAIVPPVCEALQYAHEQGIVHRDIKPENLLLDKAGRVKIADFGIAKLVARHSDVEPDAPEPADDAGPSQPPDSTLESRATTAGTPGYMAPEQKSAPQRVDSRADIYSLGVVIYEMLTGELPAEKLQPPSRKVQIDVRLDEIVLRALEQRPELRFQTAADLRTQVQTVVSTPRGNREEAQTSSLPPRFLKAGTSTLTTPEQLATVSGQFFCHRTRGQLILDDRQLTHSCAGTNTVIPLAAIRDLSIGRYPRTMNPAGIDFLSVTYEDGGQRRQVLLSPMKGWFSEPTAFNAHIAEWHAALREAVHAATGQTPASSPVQAIGAPFNSLAPLLALASLPVLVGAGLMMFVRRNDAAAGFSGALGLFEAAIFATSFLAVLLVNWFLAGRMQRAGRWLVLTPVLLLLGLLGVWFLARFQSSSGVTRFDTVPVGVSNNVVIVDVTAEVGRGNAELRAMLDGPSLPAATEAALADAFFPPFAGTFIKPTPHAGNHPWRILAPGRQTWRLGFVLPDAALARDAMDSLHPVGPLPAEPDRTFAGTLFEVRQTNGQMFRASLQVALPFTSADPDWVSVFGHSQHNESTVTLTWEVLAAGHGLAHFSRAGTPILTLQSNPQTKLYGTSVQLQLTKVGTNLVRFVRRTRGATATEEFPGDFRELADEMLRTATFSAKATSGTKIELCRFQGTPFVVQVHVTDSPGTYKLKLGVAAVVGAAGLLLLVAAIWFALRKRQPGVSPASNLGAVLVRGLVVFGLLIGAALLLILFWASRSDGPVGMPLPVWGMGAVVLPLAAAGMVLLIVLLRRGGSASKAVTLLVGVPLLGVALFIAVWVLARARVADSATELDQMVLESNYPAPAQPYPPGRVQQTQNGFRLRLPSAQLASFEFFLRQADDSLQPVPSLTALVATGQDGRYHDTLHWTLRRSGAAETTNQLWFWTVSANANAGRPLPQLTDHGTNFTHQLGYGESLDWWQLAVPATVTLKPGEQQIIPLFRTHGTATVRGGHPKEAFLRVRCEPLPAGLSVSLGQQLVEAGLAARALLAKTLAPTTNGLTTRFSAVREFVLSVSSDRADFLDLDFGKVVAGPVGTDGDLRSDTPPSPFLKRVRAEDVDFGWVTNRKGVITPVCIDMGYFTLPREWSIRGTMGAFTNVTNTWDNLPAESLKDWDQVMPKVFHTGLYMATNTADVQAIFETRNGTRGLMHITEFTENPRSLKVRYKLVQLVAAPSPTASAPPNQPVAGPLVRREVKQANPGGKDLVMTFEELRRDARTSTATVKRTSGASVPSAMFIARGAYDIARARGAAYFINLKEWDAEDGTRMYLIGFATDKNVDPKTYFDLKEPLPADKRLQFLSVQAYERMFRDQP